MAAEAGVVLNEEGVGHEYDLPPIISAADFAGWPVPRPRQLIEGLLNQGEKMVLGGSSKTNKTWSCVDLGLSVATGCDWWGFRTHPARVLYVNLEIQDFFMQLRLKQICDAKRITVPAMLDLWNLRGHACDAQDLVCKIIARASDDEYGLIIIDPIYKTLAERNENDASDIADLCNHYERLAVTTGAAVLYAAPFSKGNQAAKSSIDRIGGSGVWARDADTILTITAHQDEDTYVVESTVRNARSVPPFGLKWNWPLMLRDDAVDTRKLRTGRTPQYSPEQLLRELTPDGLAPGEWQAKVMTAAGMSETSFKNLQRRLKREHKVELQNGRYRVATDWDKPAVS